MFFRLFAGLGKWERSQHPPVLTSSATSGTLPVMTGRGKSYAQEAVHQRIGRPLDEALRELYVERRHSQQEIADALGVSRSLVREWLADFGINRDDRPAVAL